MRTFEIYNRKKIGSIADLLKEIDSIKEDKEIGKVWYRGHNKKCYKLMPTIGRRYEYSGNSIQFNYSKEFNLLHRFRRRAYPEVKIIMNEWEAIFLARHYELPTRILDWTANPLVALYFVCSNNENESGNLWGIARIKDETNDLDMLEISKKNNPEDSPFLMYIKSSENRKKATKNSKTRSDLLSALKEEDIKPAIKILHPFYNSPRMIAQSGVFTFHSQPFRTMDSYANTTNFEDDALDIYSLYCWEVIDKKKIVKQLENFAISERTVFPDLNGLAKGLWQSEVLWNGKQYEKTHFEDKNCV